MLLIASHLGASMLQVVLVIYHLEFLTKLGQILLLVSIFFIFHCLYFVICLELSAKITVTDINPDMLNVGKKRAVERGSFHDLDFKVVNAEDLSDFESDSLDLYTIAFGIRNVTDRPQALKEAHRVLRRGGRFMCLEFSEVQIPLFKQVYDTYSFNAIPILGQLLANDRDSYQYLVESIRKFPKQAEFASLIEEAGFKVVTYTNYTGGIVALHSGYKF